MLPPIPPPGASSTRLVLSISSDSSSSGTTSSISFSTTGGAAGGGGAAALVAAGAAGALLDFETLGASRSRKTRLDVFRFPDLWRSSSPDAGGGALGALTRAEEPRLFGSLPYIFRCSVSISRRL